MGVFMPNEVVFVGAGPIGLWTAIQIKLQRPETDIVFKEKKEEYTRSHTLLLKPTSFVGCLEDDTGVIRSIIQQLEENPHIRTNDLEQRLKALAIGLGIRIDTHAVESIERDVLVDHPEAAMVIGSDGVRSKVHAEIFGDEVNTDGANTQRVALAYAAQIKYSVNGAVAQDSALFQTYPLLKHSNHLASVNVGKLKDGKTPITIQFVIDKDTYDQISHATYARPIRLLADSVEEQVPPALLKDVKTYIGYRLKNGEDIIVSDINLTASELPQQRRRKVTTLESGRYYGVIGDAALALSYFKGMNRGLQLATKFSQAIVTNWDRIVARDVTAFDDYEQQYDQFATAAFRDGLDTNRSIRKITSAIQTSAVLPFQVIYFDNNTIADFHRCFDIYNQACQFYIRGQISEADAEGRETEIVPRVPSAQNIREWVEGQWTAGFTHLRDSLLVRVEEQVDNPRLHKALMDLVALSTTATDFYEKVNVGLAFSKIKTLLEEPTPQNYQACVKFAERLKSVGSNFSLTMSSLLELIVGIVAITFGIVAMVSTGGAAAPYSVPLVSAGALLAGHGLYKLQKNLQGQSPIYKAVEAVINERGRLEDGPLLSVPIAEIGGDVPVDPDMPEFEIVEAEPEDPDAATFTR